VSAEIANGQCRLSVRDDEGPGIVDPARCLERLASSKPGHWALGLCMARRIAVRFGGDLSTARHPGGAEVSRLLPILVASSPHKRPAPRSTCEAYAVMTKLIAMIRHYARLNPDRVSKELLNREGVIKLNDFGAQLGFGVSVLRERQFFQGESGVPPTPNAAQPILTWPFLDFLDHLVLREQSLIELGAGYSTLWFAKRFARVRSFETDASWHAALSKQIPDNVELSLVAIEQLEGAELEYRGESWLLIDFAGKRTAFIKRFLTKLSKDNGPAAIVLDNADWYRRGASILREHGYLEVPFYGFKSGQSWVSCTSLFLDPARFAATQQDPFFKPSFSREPENDWDSI
jgi:hypothetical protein